MAGPTRRAAFVFILVNVFPPHERTKAIATPMRYPPAAARFSGIALPASVEDLVGGALHPSLTPNAPIFSGKKQPPAGPVAMYKAVMSTNLSQLRLSIPAR